MCAGGWWRHRWWFDSLLYALIGHGLVLFVSLCFAWQCGATSPRAGRAPCLAVAFSPRRRVASWCLELYSSLLLRRCINSSCSVFGRRPAYVRTWLAHTSERAAGQPTTSSLSGVSTGRTAWWPGEMGHHMPLPEPPFQLHPARRADAFQDKALKKNPTRSASPRTTPQPHRLPSFSDTTAAPSPPPRNLT